MKVFNFYVGIENGIEKSLMYAGTKVQPNLIQALSR